MEKLNTKDVEVFVSGPFTFRYSITHLNTIFSYIVNHKNTNSFLKIYVSNFDRIRPYRSIKFLINRYNGTA